MAPTGPLPMTEEEYWRDYEVISDDVHAAIVTCYTHRALNHLIATDQDVYAKVNANPEFWRATSYSLQNMMFILLSRILDTDGKVHSLHNVLNSTTGHPEFFSRAARRARAIISQVKWGPAELAEFDRVNTWEPDANDLRDLKKDLKPHQAKFEAIYRPIRNHVAHIIFKDDAKIADLYGKTQKTDIDDILCFLHGLLRAIRYMAENGQPLDIKVDNYGFRKKANRIMRETEEMLKG